MNIADAREAMDEAAEGIVSFALRSGLRIDGGFALMYQECDDDNVRRSQAAEKAIDPDRPLMATAGMRPGTYAVLLQVHKDKSPHTVWMSTHVAERDTQAEFVAAAKGRVLVAGLGLGLVLPPLLKKPEVTEIVVVEKNMEVYRIMRPELDRIKKTAPRKLRIVMANILTWTPTKAFDTIYFDIWPQISARNLTEMVKLRIRFEKWLRPGGWIGCWAEAECKEMLRREEKRLGPRAGLILAEIDRLVGKQSAIHVCQVPEGY